MKEPKTASSVMMGKSWPAGAGIAVAVGTTSHAASPAVHGLLGSRGLRGTLMLWTLLNMSGVSAC